MSISSQIVASMFRSAEPSASPTSMSAAWYFCGCPGGLFIVLCDFTLNAHVSSFSSVEKPTTFEPHKQRYVAEGILQSRSGSTHAHIPNRPTLTTATLTFRLTQPRTLVL